MNIDAETRRACLRAPDRKRCRRNHARRRALKADVFRPDDDGKFPAILNLGPYQKDKVWIPPSTLEDKAEPYMNWETRQPGMVGT